MSAHEESHSIFKKARTYCIENPQRYQLYLNRIPTRFLFSPIIVQLITISIIVVHHKRNGGAILHSGIACLCLISIPFLLNKIFSGFATVFKKISNYYWDAILFCTINVLSYSYYQMHALGNTNPNGPIQTALLGICLFYFHRNFLYLFVRNIIIAATCASVIAYLDFEYFKEVGIQFPGGFTFGTWVCYWLHKGETIRFFSLETYQNKNAHAYREMSKLLYRHQIYEIENGNHIESTMPTDTKDCCVISFDIQNSSWIGHSQHHVFFDEVIRKCHALMLENYDENTLIGNAHMIKEMGDGFLCSVGFPLLWNGNIHQKSYQLALEFIHIFMREAESYFKDRYVYCAAGIAFGDVTGMFPRVGIKNYEIYGDAIVKAKRYESFRKVILENIEQDNILVLQDRVYQNLTTFQKSKLICYSVDKNKVRDDPEVEGVYYKRISYKNRRISNKKNKKRLA